MRRKILLILLTFALVFISLPIYSMDLPNGYLEYGSGGIRVERVQGALNKIGYHIYADGIYGKNTRAAIIDLQEKYKELRNDGVYGPNTRRIIEELTSEKNIGESKPTNENLKVGQASENTRTAYLTFDDGPSDTVTPEILDILEEYDIKATFFMLGEMAEKSPSLVKEVEAKGHSIGNHSYSHKYDYIYKNMDNFLGEINKTDNIFKNILGEDFNTDLLRFPGGSFENYKQKYKARAEDMGYNVYNWNALNGDAEGKKVSVDKLVSRLKETTKGEKELIVLMHDTYGKETTAKALPRIIDYLKNQGYSFEKLD